MSPTRKKQAERQPAPAGAGSAAVEQFYADAHAIEIEASTRYRVLAREMEASGNARTADLFRKLAQLEAGHADKLKQAAAPESLARAREQLLSRKGGQTEVPNYEFLYRDVPPYHALIMALESERLARAYFERIRENARDPEVKKLAAEFARDEERHIAWLEKALAKEPRPAAPFDAMP